MSDSNAIDEDAVLYDQEVDVTVTTPQGKKKVDIFSPEGYKILSKVWLLSAFTRGGDTGLSENSWLGLPIVQLPEDLLMMQELLYRVRPDVIVETGTAGGGSAVFYASMLELLGKGRVISVDIDLKEYTRRVVECHPLGKRITLLEGSSTDPQMAARVAQMIQPGETVLVALDSDHKAAHVYQELEAYHQLVTVGSYLVVFDTTMEHLRASPLLIPEIILWNNPLEAVRAVLKEHPEFAVDPFFNRLTITYCQDGFLRRLPAASTDQEEAEIVARQASMSSDSQPSDYHWELHSAYQGVEEFSAIEVRPREGELTNWRFLIPEATVVVNWGYGPSGGGPVCLFKENPVQGTAALLGRADNAVWFGASATLYHRQPHSRSAYLAVRGPLPDFVGFGVVSDPSEPLEAIEIFRPSTNHIHRGSVTSSPESGVAQCSPGSR